MSGFDGQSSKRSNGRGVTEELVYQYALRVAYLAYLTQPKAPKAPKAPMPPPPAAVTFPITRSLDPPSSKRLSHIPNITNFSDYFKDSDKKVQKILIKLLRERLDVIISGGDPNPIYRDPYFMKDLQIFHHSLQQPGFRQQFKTNNSKIEDIVLIFLKTSQSELKKAQLPPTITWQSKLTEHVSQFVGILKECLQSKECASPITHELLARLEIYQTKMSTPATNSGTTNGSSSASIDDMDMVKVVKAVFHISSGQIQKDVNALKKDCTLQTALEDLRNVLNHVNRGSPFPARREDFESDEAYTNWKGIEKKIISDIMASLILLNPGLTAKEPTGHVPSLLTTDHANKSNPRRTIFAPHPEMVNESYHKFDSQQTQYTPGIPQQQSMYPSYNNSYQHQPHPQYQQQQHHNNNPNFQQSQYSPYNTQQPPYNTQQPPYNTQQPPYNPHQSQHFPYNPILETKESYLPIESSNEGGSFTFIPPSPRSYYKLLMNKCIEYELNHGVKEEQSVKILSKGVIDLLNECALRWRVSPGFRWLQYLDVIRSRFDSEDLQITLNHIKEGMHLLKDATKKRDPSTWTITDRREFVEVYSGIHDSLLKYMRSALEHIIKIKASEFDPILFLLSTIYESELFMAQYPDVSPFYNDLRECVRKVAVDEYKKKRDQIYSMEHSNEVQALIALAQWIQEAIGKLSTKFPRPLIGQLDTVRLVMERQVPLLSLDMENAATDIIGKVKMTHGEGIPVDDIFKLYREILEVKNLFEICCPGAKFTFGIVEWFGPHVRKWLDSTDSMTPDWVHSAISVDELKPVSATDTHSSSVVDLFTSFNQTVDFVKRLNWPNQNQSARFMTSLSRTISKALEQYCVQIQGLFMKEIMPAEEAGQEASKQSGWYVRAKIAIASEKLVPFNIKPKPCIMMNNIEAANEQLDRMYNSMNVDALSSIVSKSASNEKVVKDRYLYTIKIVMAENLAGLDTNGLSDPYCVLTDEQLKTLAKTRTIYETLNPRWDEAFDITIESGETTRVLCATVWDSDQLGSDDICGKACIHLDPRYFDDFLAHDVWLDLDSQGRILLRVSMEGEKDEPQFHFGKAFRTLKRAHDEMARIIVDRMSPFLRQSLSRDVLNKLLKTARGGFGGFFGDNEKSKMLTEREIEEPLDPLFDFFDQNLMTLSNYLHPKVFEMVMTRVWKEIESIIELLILPPLSDRPSDMKALTGNELDVVYKWFRFLQQYLNADGNGVSNDILENTKYHEIKRIAMFYDMETDTLKQEYLHSQINNTLTPRISHHSTSKSVLNQRNLGTIKKRKTEKRKQKQDDGEIILRILRMRSGTKTFLRDQMEDRIKKQQAVASDVLPPLPRNPNAEI